jgi:gliding motility-associated-like protein
VKPIPNVTSASVLGETICSGDTVTINLNPSLLGTTLSWTVLQNGVSGGANGSGTSIIDTLETTGNSLGNAFYTVTPTLNLCIGQPINIPITVNPLPLPELESGIICVDVNGVAYRTYTLDSGLNAIDYSFQWFIDGVAQTTGSNTFEALVAGNYSVIATNSVTGCISSMVSATVTASNPATSFTATVSSLYFSDNASITASAIGGNGTYQYSLDYGPFQTSPVFEDVAPGEHVISINDTNGCTNLLPITLNTIGYPTYFTPNGDGFHDYWNIIGLENQPTAKVYIFDRYGKLIKQISTKSLGWDGTYNGNPLPASDYWFTIDYLEPNAKTFKAHFSLKR